MKEVKINEIKSEFLLKLKNREYISEYLYRVVKSYKLNIIPRDFNIDKYNELVLEDDYLKYKDYFDNMYKDIDPNIRLDKEQIKAILADEEYSLIIAGAGTGKTTTMASKVKYLVDIKGVDPSKIVVMSYTAKATEELEKRIVLDFNIPARVTTFHALGLMHIRNIYKPKKCYVVDNNKKEEIFLDYFINNIFPYKERVKEIIDIFDSSIVSERWLFGNYFKDNYDKFESFDKYFESYKRKCLNEIGDLKKAINEKVEFDLNSDVIRTIKGEIVKSKGEAIIANFLYTNGIEYEYEKIYEEFLEDNKIYRPDFTLKLGGNFVYLEYFGLSTYNDQTLNRYNKIKKKKEDYHYKRHNKFIKIDYMKGEDILINLKNQLIEFGFSLNPISDEEIYNTILDRNKASQFFPFRDFMLDIIDTIKLTSKRENYSMIVNDYISQLQGSERDEAVKQWKYIDEFCKYYQSSLCSVDANGFDFSDMIYYANRYINRIGKNNALNFEYLIIDEYQDISEDRYILTKNIVNRNGAKVVAVGDDWQSIFSFSGAKIEYIYNFLKYFPGAKLLKITNTYRNSKELIDYSGKFVMKNEDQLKKELVSKKNIINPIRFEMFDDDYEYDCLKKLILRIHNDNPKHNILVLARSNKAIDRCYNEKDLKDDIGSKITYVGYEDILINGMTIHKSKGLTADEVIVMELDQNFPRDINKYFWTKNLFRNRLKIEQIPFAEERRLFYVALTRTKNYVYLLTNRDVRKRSPFIREIYEIVHEIDG